MSEINAEDVTAGSPTTAEEEMSETGVEDLQFVTFEMEGEEFAVDILRVQEIIKPVEVTDAPQYPDFLDGLINLREKVIPVVNLRKRFNYPIAEPKSENRVIVVDIEGKTIGLHVDSVSEILRISPDKIEPAPTVECRSEANHLSGIAQIEDRIVVVIDIDKILNEQMIQVLGSQEPENM